MVNPHKWLFTPLDASLLLTRRMRTSSAPRSASCPSTCARSIAKAPVRDYNEYTPQLGRRFRALKLWIQLRWFGLDGLRRRIEAHLAMAAEFAAWVDADPDWERLAPVPFSTVCFRWRPAGRDLEDAALDTANAAIMDAVNRTGEVFLSHTRLGGRFTIRLAVGNLRTEPRHVERAWALLGEAAAGWGVSEPRPHDVRFFSSPVELRDWFDANHATATELWLGHHRKSTGRPTIAWSDAVDEALCVGWIDGVRFSLDDERFAQRFTPRRKGSNWSAINVQKVSGIAKQGRMRPAGLGRVRRRGARRRGPSLLLRAARRHVHCGGGRAFPGGRSGLGRLAAPRTVVPPGR